MSDVLAITNNLQQASSRLRLQSLVEPLALHGVRLKIEVRPRGLLARRRLLRTAGRFDAVLVQRKLLNPSDLSLLRRQARKIYFDVDDAVMLHSKPVGPLERWIDHRRFVATAKSVDLVVAGSDYLAGLFREQGAKAAVLPTVVDPAHYRIKQHARTDAPALVWIGSKSTLPYLERLLPALVAAKADVAGLRLITIADEPLSGANLPTEHIPWSVETESEALCRGDIGIAPMPDDPWTRGKCGFKIVQYMAAGLPVIASPVGANAELVVDGETGFLAKDDSDWRGKIAKLATDLDLRKKMGAAGRKRVEEQFSLGRAVDFWAKLLGDARSLT